MRCPACSTTVSDLSTVCPSCGGSLTPAAVATVTSAGEAFGSRLQPAADQPRTAGSILAGRYRIVGLLGRGGMGEVYCADDLKLAQPVALKFLAAGVATDPAALARFHTEVRVARQVSHPNVCRIYNLSEVDGQPFLSMEYVDGEDLSSLVRAVRGGRAAGCGLRPS